VVKVAGFLTHVSYRYASLPRMNGGSNFSRGSGSASKMMPLLVHTAQWATAANLAFILAALCFAFGLPRTLERSAETA
jgi:hypothetical protein